MIWLALIYLVRTIIISTLLFGVVVNAMVCRREMAETNGDL